MEWGRSSRKINETWVHPHVTTRVFTKIWGSFKHPAQSRRRTVHSHRPASRTLPPGKAGVPGLSLIAVGVRSGRGDPPSAEVGSGQVRVQ